jgi:hypothetical protein
LQLLSYKACQLRLLRTETEPPCLTDGKALNEPKDEVRLIPFFMPAIEPLPPAPSGVE